MLRSNQLLTTLDRKVTVLRVNDSFEREERRVERDLKLQRRVDKELQVADEETRARNAAYTRAEANVAEIMSINRLRVSIENSSAH